MPRLLIIDDDHGLFSLLAEYLGGSGFDCFHAADADSGLAALGGGGWDAVVLDVMLPGKCGHEVLAQLRDSPATRDLPVLMLTARGDEDDKVAGLELGADDYMAKPFGAKELVARLRALLRRAGRAGVAETEGGGFLQFDGLAIDREALCLVQDGGKTSLTVSELRLLELFAAAPGRVLGRDALYREVLGHPPFPQDRSLDMMISRLRKKLGPRSDRGERIRAARGAGYVFLLPGDRK